MAGSRNDDGQASRDPPRSPTQPKRTKKVEQSKTKQNRASTRSPCNCDHLAIFVVVCYSIIRKLPKTKTPRFVYGIFSMEPRDSFPKTRRAGAGLAIRDWLVNSAKRIYSFDRARAKRLGPRLKLSQCLGSHFLGPPFSLDSPTRLPLQALVTHHTNKDTGTYSSAS